jgi:hypothetical protein
LVAIGCAAVVNRLAYFHLKNCGVWIAAAARQIAGKPYSHRVIKAPRRRAPNNSISNKNLLQMKAIYWPFILFHLGKIPALSND